MKKEKLEWKINKDEDNSDSNEITERKKKE